MRNAGTRSTSTKIAAEKERSFYNTRKSVSSKLRACTSAIRNSGLNSETVEPLCLAPFNNARECVFQTDGAFYTCKKYIDYFVQCQNNPAKYAKLLENSTEEQKKPVIIDFERNKPKYDRHV